MFRKSTFVMAILIIAIGAWNYLSLQKNISKVITSDPRNDGISVFVHYQWFINPNVIVFDLREISSTKSTMDVSRTLLQLSKQLQKNSYNRVILAFKGSYKFILKGDYFKQTGQEYAIQNPMYILRNLPQNVYNLDETNAFSTWSGGLLGVLGKQLEDLNEFHQQWYLTSLLPNS